MVCAPIKAGNVWVTDFLSGQIIEYARGGKTLTATLSNEYGGPVACSVDTWTGDLGVSTYQSGVAVYKNAQELPVLFADSKFRLFSFCAYDHKGNLFVDGQVVNTART